MKYKKHIFTPTFRSFSANLGEKAFDSVEVDKSPTLATPSMSDLAKNAHAHYGMWVTFLFYLTLSYLLFAFSIGFNLTKGFIGPYIHDQIQFIWTLYWWPYAISHHINPFLSTVIWHPYGTDVSIAPASVPGASLIALPNNTYFWSSSLLQHFDNNRECTISILYFIHRYFFHNFHASLSGTF